LQYDNYTFISVPKGLRTLRKGCMSTRAREKKRGREKRKLTSVAV
jgi:hypothetical protein